MSYTPDWDHTRQTFFRFFVSLLLDYRKFLVLPSTEVPKPDQRFNRQAFIDSHPKECAEFFETLVCSQAFTNFVDERVQVDNATANVVFFDQVGDPLLIAHSLFSTVRTNARTTS